MKKNYVFLVTTGSGDDGDEWNVESIHSTYKLAEKARDHYQRPQYRKDGSVYNLDADIEEWSVEIEAE